MTETIKSELDAMSLEEIYNYINNRVGIKVGKKMGLQLRLLSKLERTLNDEKEDD